MNRFVATVLAVSLSCIAFADWSGVAFALSNGPSVVDCGTPPDCYTPPPVAECTSPSCGHAPTGPTAWCTEDECYATEPGIGCDLAECLPPDTLT